MDLEIMKKIIKEITTGHADIIASSLEAERYYRNQNDILTPPPKTAAEQATAENPLRSADNRIPTRFHGLLVNQKAAYLFTAPPVFDIGDDAGNAKLAETLGDNFAKVCKDLCINASNTGVGWIHYWVDKKNEFQYAVVDTTQIIPIWTTSLNKELAGVMRVYPERDMDTGENYKVYEYWTDTACEAFRTPAGLELDKGLEVYCMFTSFIVDAGVTNKTNVLIHGEDRVPFIPFFNNNLKAGDLVNVKKHIDTYDAVYSGFVNDLEDVQQIIYILINYEGTNLDEFMGKLKRQKAINVSSDGDGDNSGLKTLTIDIPVEARKILLELTRKTIFEQGEGVDPRPETVGNTSGEALKFMYALLELKAGLLETEFRLGFGAFIRALCGHLGLSCKKVSQTWERTMIKSDTDLAALCNSSVGVVSHRSVLRKHPLVENVDEELKTIKKEAKEAEDSYMEAFNAEAQDAAAARAEEEADPDVTV